MRMGIDDAYAAHTIGSLEELLSDKDARIKDLEEAHRAICEVAEKGGSYGKVAQIHVIAHAALAGKGE
jgi:hypothetical protein